MTDWCYEVPGGEKKEELYIELRQVGNVTMRNGDSYQWIFLSDVPNFFDVLPDSAGVLYGNPEE